MAQFDVYRGEGRAFLLDCQADLFDSFNSRLIVPLIPIAEAPQVDRRLHPTFDVAGERYVMMTEFTAAIATRELGRPIASLAEHRYDILGAIDLLVTGY